MNIILSQRDGAWSRKRLGFGTGTIGQYGCVITSIAMCLRERGYNVNPVDVNEKLKEVGGFVGSTKNLVNWSAVYKAFPQFKYVGSYNYNTTPAPLNELDNYLKQGYNVILKMNGYNIGGRGDHFVKAERVEGDNVVIQDPWFGEEALITKRYTRDWADTAVEIITGFRVSQITPSQGEENMNDDEMIIKKKDFTNMHHKSSQYDDLGKKYGFDPSNTQAEFMINLFETEKKRKEDAEKAKEAVEKREGETNQQLQSCIRTSGSRRETLQYIATKLDVAMDESEIKGAIEDVIDIEDKLRAAEKEIDKVKAEHATEKKGLLKEIDLLKEDIENWKGKADELTQNIEKLEKKIDGANEKEEKDNILVSLITDLVNFFTRKKNQKDVEGEKNDEQS